MNSATPARNTKVMNRFDVTSRLIARLKHEEAVIGGIGNTNFDLWAAGHRPQNFYMLGSMGLAFPIALGVALAQPDRRVFALEGDGSLHTWGVAVDVTLADSKGREIAMPTGFDEFTPAARLRYSGDDPAIKMHIKALRDAMHKGGFVGEVNEWWHFVASDWKKYAPIREARKISD